ncbi:YycH family regulatory protein [Alkalicoccus daliensis]|uniref:Two-component signal transduction system YycFG, regulatory protein YycH n=1 Tax=Alkalicoccus daliensis TaxID=745820 RepID=A0A1H0FQQ5_9BACI|nr:two-component system activity regulator YycH [Alkalicoccus daliensis]SDN96975.1 Two-component signal transduction system YycFG, regulatory protein YycH [Alkalicoccus daliensis]
MRALEHIKTFVLWLMILTSVVLTWFVWTYQPAYDELGETDNSYIEIEDIGEAKSFSQLLYPTSVLRHEEEDISWIHPAEDNYLELLEAISEIGLDNMRTAGTENAPSLDWFFEGIQMTFDEPLEGEWLQYIVDIEEENILIDYIDRIVITDTEANNGGEVTFLFIDMEAEEVYQSETTISSSQLRILTQRSALEQTAVEPHIFQEREDSDFQPVRYVASEPLSQRVYTYETTNISPDGFIQTLFADPGYVKQYFQEGQSSSYTDGTRMMDMLEGGSLLHFVQPDLSAGAQISTSSVVRSGQEFVNGHFGWTDDFYATSWNESGTYDQAEFTLHVGGMPVLDANSNNENHYKIELQRSGTEIIEYIRPMFQLDLNPFEIDTNVELPSYEELEEIIEEEDMFPLSAIEDAKIAYYMSRQNSFAVFEPSWFVFVRGQWQRVSIPDRNDQEVMPNGLE